MKACVVSKRWAAILVSVLLLGNSGCAVMMAVHQPDKKDLSVVRKGTARAQVVAELGNPVSTEMKEGKRVDIYRFVQGYNKGTKALRALVHGAADVFTAGIWEAVGTPAEAIMDGSELAIQIVFNEQDLVEQTVLLKGKNNEIKKYLY